MKTPWPEYMLKFARVAADRASCLRAHVGAVISTSDFRLVATGYNGSPAGEPECIDIGCDIVDNHCIRTIHAEQNAIAYAARRGVSTEGCLLWVWFNRLDTNNFIPPTYTERDLVSLFRTSMMVLPLPLSTFPCNTCKGVIIASGIHDVIVQEPHNVTTWYSTRYT